MRLLALEEGTASPEIRRAAMALIAQSLPEFYEVLGRYIDDLPAVVEARMAQRGGELQNCHILCDGDTVAGVFCCYPSVNLAVAQMTDLRAMLRRAEKDRKTLAQDELSASTGRMAPVPPDGCYLSRFAVATTYRGMGIADILMDGFKDFASGNAALYLHVNKDNARAIAFYRRHGFDFTEADSEYVHRTMALTSNAAQPAKYSGDGTGPSSETR
jgi:ribosomal protein S18 acetylase RimI-like enzyme